VLTGRRPTHRGWRRLPAVWPSAPTASPGTPPAASSPPRQLRHLRCGSHHHPRLHGVPRRRPVDRVVGCDTRRAARRNRQRGGKGADLACCVAPVPGSGCRCSPRGLRLARSAVAMPRADAANTAAPRAPRCKSGFTPAAGAAAAAPAVRPSEARRERPIPSATSFTASATLTAESAQRNRFERSLSG
jgi:hypothetical protein